MPRRRAWNGRPPQSPTEARRRLIEAARECVERYGPTKAGLKDVAEAAGVTRQTVYRYFESTEALFQSAAALASGGFQERMRAQALARDSLAERVVECLVFTIHHLPEEPQLREITMTGEHFGVQTAVALGFVQQEILTLADGEPVLTEQQLDELAEILVRLLHSSLLQAGPPRNEDELRDFLYGWLVPMIDAQLALHAPRAAAR